MKAIKFVMMWSLSALGHAAEPVSIEPVTLKKTAPIVWEGRSHETIDGAMIEGDVSIHLNKCSDVVISACDLRSIELEGCQGVSIHNCFIHDSKHCGIQAYKSEGLQVQGCRFERVMSGAYVMESQHVQVMGCFCQNVQGPFPRGQMVQFDSVTGSGNLVSGNYAINECDKSHPEDVINIYMSAGTADSPILVENNYLTGDPVLGSKGKSKNGSSIMLADQGGAHELCRKNVVISAGQMGIGVAGGTFIAVEDNLVYGEKSDVSNNGLYAWNQSGKPSGEVSITGNRVHWTNHDGEETSWWPGGGVENLHLAGNQFAAPLTAAELPAPPSQAPLPPGLWVKPNAAGVPTARVGWSPK